MQDIRKGLETKRIPARDCNDSRVSVGSMVELVDGPYRGKVGTVKHVYKMHVWLSCRDVTAVRCPLGPAAYRNSITNTV